MNRDRFALAIAVVTVVVSFWVLALLADRKPSVCPPGMEPVKGASYVCMRNTPR